MEIKEIAEKYRENADKLADAISEIKDIYESLKYVSERAQDNGDPYFLLSEAFVSLGSALAVCLVYAKEYEEEMKNKKPKKD